MVFLCCSKLNIFLIIIAADSVRQRVHLLPNLHLLFSETGESFFISVHLHQLATVALGFSATKNLKGYLMIKKKPTIIEIYVIKLCWIQLNYFYL